MSHALLMLAENGHAELPAKPYSACALGSSLPGWMTIADGYP